MKVHEIKNLIGDEFLATEILSFLLSVPRMEIRNATELPILICKKAIKIAEKYKHGVPLQYQFKRAWFYGLPFYVNKHVLIPRGDTEVLVEAVLGCLKGRSVEKEPRILDLCTGSGCIAITLAKNTNAQVTASDISKKALRVAQKNAKSNNVKVSFVQSDLFQNITGEFDVIVSNPPYVRTGEIGAEDKTTLREPKLALDGGVDGLDFYRKISAGAQDFVVSGGMLALEIGHDQGWDVSAILEGDGWQKIKIIKDIEERDRVVIGYK